MFPLVTTGCEKGSKIRKDSQRLFEAKKSQSVSMSTANENDEWARKAVTALLNKLLALLERGVRL